MAACDVGHAQTSLEARLHALERAGGAAGDNEREEGA